MNGLELTHSSESEGPELRALALQNFVSRFTPSNWKEPVGRVIGSADYTVLADDMAEMEQRYRDGSLASYLENKYRFPAVRLAILEYFRQQ